MSESEVSSLNFQPLDIPYESTPWFRRRWFAMLMMLFFIPAFIVIALSGDLYACRSGRTYRYGDSQKLLICFAGTLIVGLNFWRALTM